MDERAVFLKFELFAKRLNKLIDMFTTIHQFSSLEQHTHIAGARSCTLRMYN
jgi:dynein heavy chain